MVDSVDSYKNPSGLGLLNGAPSKIPGYQDFQVLDQPNVAGLTYGDSPVFQAGLEKAEEMTPFGSGLATLGSKLFMKGNPVAMGNTSFYAPSVESIIGKDLEQAKLGDLAKLESGFTNPYGHEVSHLGFDAPLNWDNISSQFAYNPAVSMLPGTSPAGTITAGSEELPNYIHDAIYGNQPISQHLIGSGYAEDGAFTQQAYEDLQGMGLPQWQVDALGMGGLSPYTPAHEGGIHAASAQLADIQQSIADNLFATPDYSQVEQMNQLANQIAATRPSLPTGPTMADVAGPTVDYEPTIEPSPPSPALIDDPFNRPWATEPAIEPTIADVAGPVGPTPEEIRQQEINDYMQLYNTHMGNISVGSNPTRRQVDDAFRFFGPYGVTGVPGWLNESSPNLNSLFRGPGGIVEALQFGGYTPQSLNESVWESYINPVDMPTNTVFSQAGWVDPYEGM